ncbi:MAG: YfcC family protein [Solirubrobacterales bacterium]|nr:YfcC family protein [Solirubrobacterales bacterium]
MNDSKPDPQDTGETQSPDPPAPDQEEATERKQMRFPTAFTVLALVMLGVWVASFVIPSGSYEIDPKSGGPVPGSYQELPSCSGAKGEGACVDKSLDKQFSELWTATPNGLYGIENARGNVDPDNTGFLYGSAMIFLFVLAVGAFITVTMKTGAIQTGIGRLAIRFRHTGSLLVIALMSVFALGGTTYGMWEETLGFFALVVPLALAVNCDRLVGASIIFLGAGTGVLASTVNPFATGVASDAAGIEVGDGIVLRVAMFIVLVGMAIGYVLLYCRKIAADPSKSIVGISDEDAEESRRLVQDVDELTTRQKVILGVFATAFVIMIYGFVPWADVMDTIFGTGWPLPTFDTFYFAEASMLFIVAAVVIGLIGRLGEKKTVDAIVSGAGDFLGAALIIVLARGVTVIMKNASITDTIISWTENAVSGTSGALFGPLAFLVNLPIAFLVPSSSGHAALIMPILAPLADLAGVDKSISVTAYQAASGLVNYITPTSAIVMGGLVLAKVRYDHYLRFLLPFFGAVFVVVCAFLAIGQAFA